MKKVSFNELVKQIRVFRDEAYPVIYEAIGGDLFCYKYNVVTREVLVYENRVTLYMRFAERVNGVMSIRIFQNGVDHYDIIFTAVCEFSAACKKISLVGVEKKDLRAAIEAEIPAPPLHKLN